jgi:hypothetical protein
MRRLAFLAVVAGLAIPSVAAQGEPPEDVLVRQGVQPPEAVIGQRVAVTVDVLFPDDMPAPPQVALPEVPGAQVFRFESQGTTIRDWVNGRPYVGQRSEFALFARRGGALTVPPAHVTVLDRHREVAGSASGQEATLAVAVPAGVDATQPVVSTSRLTLDQRWDPEPSKAFKVGAALRRTIIREAEDVPALAMQDLRGSTPDGVRAYPDPPNADDRSNRGTLIGRRVDRITYVFEKPGMFTLPSLEQPWWDLQAAALRSEGAPGMRLQVVPAAEAGPDTSRPSEQLPWPVYMAGLVVLGALLWVGHGVWRQLADALQTWVVRWQRSEPAEFRRLRRACRRAEPGPTYAALRRWRARLKDVLGPSRMPDADIDRAARPLDAALFGAAPSPWAIDDAWRLITRLSGLRKDALAEAAPARERRSRLPPLNPAPSSQRRIP